MADSPLLELTRARLLEIVREPGIIFWVFFFPVVMAIVLGLAFRSRPPAPVLVAVEGAEATRVVAILSTDERIAAEAMSPDAAHEALRKGEVELVVVAPGDHGARFAYRLDPTRPASRSARLLVNDALQRAAGRTDAVEVSDLEMREPGSRYIDFLIPGLIGLNLMSSSMWGLGFGIVTMRTRKLLKRFAATPMRRRDFLLAMMLSRLILLLVEMVFLVAVGWLMFGVVVRGSLLALLAVSLLGSAAFAGISLLVAARTKTVEVASGLMNAFMLPMWMMSGSFFAYTRFPEVLHPFLRALPLTALNDALRAVINDGAGLFATASEMLVLAAWMVVTFALALRIFRWQ